MYHADFIPHKNIPQKRNALKNKKPQKKWDPLGEVIACFVVEFHLRGVDMSQMRNFKDHFSKKRFKEEMEKYFPWIVEQHMAGYKTVTDGYSLLWNRVYKMFRIQNTDINKSGYRPGRSAEHPDRKVVLMSYIDEAKNLVAIAYGVNARNFK